MSCFFPGQRVICIDGKFHPSAWDWVDEMPVEGEVYTVAWVRPVGRDSVTGHLGPALALREISGRLPGVDDEVCWCFRRFAPLDLQACASATRAEKPLTRRKTALAIRTLVP